MSIEVTTHNIFRDLLRHQPTIVGWTHHLTMARLVARAFRLSQSSLIQTGIATHRSEGKYRLSYLIPALLWSESVTIAIPTAVRDRLINTELPQLQQWLGTSKQVYDGDKPPAPDFQGLWIVDPLSWLNLQLHQPELLTKNPVILDGADDLENWAQSLLTVKLTTEDWDSLRFSFGFPTGEDIADANVTLPPTSQLLSHWEQIAEIKIQLMTRLWQRPINPYNCYLLDDRDRVLIQSLLKILTPNLPPNWQKFDREFSQIVGSSSNAIPSPVDNPLLWAQLDPPSQMLPQPTGGAFTLAITPTDLVAKLAPIWERQPSILITSAVDLTAKAIGYRQELGLSEVTSIKFPLDRHKESFKLYIPRWMPMPNTRKFQPVLVDEIKHLLYLTNNQPKFIVILIQDTPLQAQIAAILAAEWGSRVQVEQTDLDEANILVSGWEFWQQHQDDLPTPGLMMIATLPIPSLEDPLVAAKVGFYKQQRQDWFRLYLLPTGLRILHRAIDPIRSSQGIVAIFDNRIDRRIYGQQVLASLQPMVRINYRELG